MVHGSMAKLKGEAIATLYVTSKGIMVDWSSSNRIKCRQNRGLNYQYRYVAGRGIHEELGQNSTRIYEDELYQDFRWRVERLTTFA